MCSMVEMKASRTVVGQRRNREETENPRTRAWAAERKVWRTGECKVNSGLLSLLMKAKESSKFLCEHISLRR